MSGAKRTRVQSQRWFQLRRNATLLVQAGVQRLDEIRREVAAGLERDEAAQRERLQAAAAVIARFGEAARRQETRTGEQIITVTAQHLAPDGELHAELRQLMQDQEAGWRAAIDAERTERRAQMQSLTGDVAGLVTDRDAARARAESWLRDARALHDLVRDQLPHEQFAPGLLEKQTRLLDAAEQNALAGLHPSALSTAQQVYFEVSDLRLRIELADARWRRRRAAARGAALLLAETIDHNTLIQLPPDEAGESYRVDVDYWAEGRLTDLRSELDLLSARLADGAAPMSDEDLVAVAERRIPELERRLAVLADEAVQLMHASQIRVNIAENATNELTAVAGYDFVDANGYVEGDERRGYLVKLRHANGSEYVVDVSPDAQLTGSSVLNLYSYDSTTGSEAEQHRRAAAVLQAMGRDEMTYDPLTTTADRADERHRDVRRRIAPARETHATARSGGPASPAASDPDHPGPTAPAAPAGDA